MAQTTDVEPSPKAIRPATEAEAEAMREFVARKQRELAAWKTEVERQAQNPEWLIITRNLVAAEIAGLLDPVGLSIDEATRGNPDQRVQLHAAWIKTVSGLIGAAGSADDVAKGFYEFAKSNLKGELRERVISLVQSAANSQPRKTDFGHR